MQMKAVSLIWSSVQVVVANAKVSYASVHFSIVGAENTGKERTEMRGVEITV